MEEQEETVQIYVASLDKTVTFPVRSSEPCKRCKGTGLKSKKPCPHCCGSGSVKMLDCIRCNGTKQIDNGVKCNVCKGKGTLSEALTNEFLEARQFCENFQKNPAKTILICLACLVALGLCAFFVSGYAFVDIRMLQSWYAYIGLIVGFTAGFYILTRLKKMHTGSYLPAATKFAISFAVIALCIAAIAIPGPVAGRYSWIEREAKEIVSGAVSEEGLSCASVKVSGADGDVYHATAKLSNGDALKINIHYEKVESHSREIAYSIGVELIDEGEGTPNE